LSVALGLIDGLGPALEEPENLDTHLFVAFFLALSVFAQLPPQLA